MPEQIMKFAFKDKQEHIGKVSIASLAYLKKHICIEIPRGSRDHVFVLDTAKIKFNLELESTEKHAVLLTM